MDFFRFDCPGCGRSIKARPGDTGRRAKCPGKACQRIVKIPAPPEPDLDTIEPIAQEPLDLPSTELPPPRPRPGTRSRRPLRAEGRGPLLWIGVGAAVLLIAASGFGAWYLTRDTQKPIAEGPPPGEPGKKTPPAPSTPPTPPATTTVTPVKPPPSPAESIVGKWSGKYPIKKISGEVEEHDETWEFGKDGTFRRVIMIGSATARQEGSYRVVNDKSLELGVTGGGAKLVWQMTLTPDTLVIAHPTMPEPGAVGAGTSTLRRAGSAASPSPPPTAGSGLPGSKGPLWEQIAKTGEKMIGADVGGDGEDPTPEKPPASRTLSSGTKTFFFAVRYEREPPIEIKIAFDLYDANGKVQAGGGVFIEERNSATGTYTMRISRKALTGAFPDGPYLMRVTFDGKVVAHVNWAVGGNATPSVPPAKSAGGLAEFAGDWVGVERYDGALNTLLVTIEKDGKARFKRTRLFDGGKIDTSLTDSITAIEKDGTDFTMKLLGATYRCRMEKERIELALTSGAGPKSWSFGRQKK